MVIKKNSIKDLILGYEKRYFEPSERVFKLGDMIEGTFKFKLCHSVIRTDAWCHDDVQNDTQHNGTQHYETYQNGINHNDAGHNKNQQND